LLTLYLRFSVDSESGPKRCPVLERALAVSHGVAVATNWRADAAALIAPAGCAIPSIANAVWVRGGEPTTGYGYLATPVNLVAGLRDVRLHAQGVLLMKNHEAEALAADFNRIMNGSGHRLQVVRSGQLICLFNQPVHADTCDPESALGRDIWGFQPTGPDATRLRLLMSEIEMWLFDHPLNKARAERGLPTISGLWLWGGGTLSLPLPALQGWVGGDDVLFGAFPMQQVFPDRILSSGVVVVKECPGTEPWAEVERRWLRPALVALRIGRISRLYLSAADRTYSLRPLLSWRLWRRARPWWEYFAGS